MDITSDVIAGIALLVSLGSFGYNIWQARKFRRFESIRKTRIAFLLGAKLMEQWQSIVLVGKGEPEEIERFREQILITAGGTQALADQLGLEVDLRSWLQADRGLLLAGTRTPFAELGDIIESAISDEKVSAGYELGVWVTFFNWAIRVGLMNGGDAANEFEAYKTMVGDINTWINRLGLDERFNPNLQKADAVAEEAVRITEAIRHELRAGT